MTMLSKKILRLTISRKIQKKYIMHYLKTNNKVTVIAMNMIAIPQPIQVTSPSSNGFLEVFKVFFRTKA